MMMLFTLSHKGNTMNFNANTVIKSDNVNDQNFKEINVKSSKICDTLYLKQGENNIEFSLSQIFSLKELLSQILD